MLCVNSIPAALRPFFPWTLTILAVLATPCFLCFAATPGVPRQLQLPTSAMPSHFGTPVTNHKSRVSRTHKLPLHPPDAILFFHRQRTQHSFRIATACRTSWGTYATP